MKPCNSCGKVVNCTADTNCWCINVPQLINADGKSCYCPECLLIENAKLVNSGVELTQDQFLSISKLGVPKDLLENIDYFINEEGNFVFSRWYHIRKGYCCKNDCLHCPY